ncbi:MAG: sigma-70 family RNA polymerase sigma factor [Acidimicrobiales bacterium]|nr:sigma-70 family RNA polymerase sigma factor [Acidimicrobiales bacterium]
MPEPLSSDLVARFRTGDDDAVRAVFRHYGGPVQTVARSMTGDAELVAEIVQQTFVKAWRAAATFDDTRDLAPWLYTIARRTAVDVLRREMQPTRGDHEPETDAAVTTMSFERTWEIHEVRRALDGLPAAEREVVRLSHLAGLSHPEIAERLEIPVGTVKSRSARAHARLAAALGHLANRTDAGDVEQSEEKP